MGGIKLGLRVPVVLSSGNVGSSQASASRRIETCRIFVVPESVNDPNTYVPKNYGPGRVRIRQSIIKLCLDPYQIPDHRLEGVT